MPETLSVRLSVVERAALDEAAAAAGVGPSALVRFWVRERLALALAREAGESDAALIQTPSRAPAARRRLVPPEGAGESRAVVRPTPEQLAGRAGVPRALAVRWLASDEWRGHWEA